ncbi:MAG: membrane dipeptidase [Deltaproteobacteria bacterium]|nr:membrane dipeptidase [Deltaproteobacteria bacterium]MBW2393472.1 membrane dipeptidase [Deltaproteobacteria bacterium]
MILLGLLVAFAWLPGWIDQGINRLEAEPPFDGSAHAKALLDAFGAVDLHADPLLWDRDLAERHDHGQIDLPRLIEGKVAVQVFGIVTQTPMGMNFERTPADDPDMVTALAVLQRWPRSTWTSRRARAEHQAANLAALAERSQGRLRILRTRGDLEDVLQAQARGEEVVGGLLGLEGMQALDGELSGVDALFAAGLRMMAPTHFFDNRIAGSSAGVEKYGLTDLGRASIRRAQELGIVIDVAHASPTTIDDLLEIGDAPMVASHTGVQATCPGPRNLSDAHVRGIAEKGGVIGIGYFAGAVCGTSPEHIARAMAHVRSLVGADHVALGSDFDGAVATEFDTTGLSLVVDALLAEGFTDDEIRRTLSANALRVFREILPK